MRDRSYWMLHLGFFTCGFPIAFLVTRLPGEIALCGSKPRVAGTSVALIGLFNAAGSLVAGALGQRYRMKWILAVMYASRALMIALYLAAPPTPMIFHIFAAAPGFTWLATVTAGDCWHALRSTLSGHPVRADLAVAPDRRILRRVTGRRGDGALATTPGSGMRILRWP